MKDKLNFELVSKILLLAINAILLSFIVVPLYEEGNIISIFGSGNILLILFYSFLELIIITNIIFIIFKFKFIDKNVPFLLNVALGFLFVISTNLNETYLSNFQTLSAFGIIYIILSFVAAFISLNNSYNSNQFSIKDIVETAMLVALAIALDLPGLKIRIGASGGSISFTMIPLFILALRQGFTKGFLSIGIVYGFTTCLIDGWGLYTYPFDYLLAYGFLSIVGFFKSYLLDKVEKPKIKHYIILASSIVGATTLRLLFSTLSGIILYETEFVASLTYNMLYVLPSGGVALAAMLLLYRPLLKINALKVANNV